MLKIWFKNILKTYIWIILPLCFIGGYHSCSNYIDAGSHLTPYSVSVRGYYRNDGTYVRSHYRRPPGSVAHDRPYERKRSNMVILFLFIVIIGSGSVVVYVRKSMFEVEELKTKINNEKQRIKSEQKKEHLLTILSKINFPVEDLKKLPQHLYISPTLHQCKFCGKSIFSGDFIIAFRAIKYYHIVCADCVRRRKSIGRNQPSIKFINELRYIDSFKTKLMEFERSFNLLNKNCKFIFSEIEIKNIFISLIKDNENKI